jgi:hypothetical protein
MAETRQDHRHDDGSGADERIERSEQLAQEARQYWDVALRGLFALPNATALSVSAAILYTTGMAERAYKRLEILTGRIGGEIGAAMSDGRTIPLPDGERSRKHQSAISSQ